MMEEGIFNNIGNQAWVKKVILNYDLNLLTVGKTMLDLNAYLLRDIYTLLCKISNEVNNQIKNVWVSEKEV